MQGSILVLGQIDSGIDSVDLFIECSWYNRQRWGVSYINDGVESVFLWRLPARLRSSDDQRASP